MPAFAFMVMPFGRNPTQAEPGKGPAEVDYDALWDKAFFDAHALVVSRCEPDRLHEDVASNNVSFQRNLPFKQDPQYSKGITIPLPNASSDPRLLLRAALFGLKRIYRPGFAYKKTGVMLIGIGPAAVQQLSLLPQHGAGDKSERLMEVMDGLNQRYGRNTVSVFSAGNRKAWAMRRENMSPCYTTNWRDVPVAQAN